MIREGAEAMGQLIIPLQMALDHLTALLEKYPLLGIWYTAFVRFFFPVLALPWIWGTGDCSFFG